MAANTFLLRGKKCCVEPVLCLVVFCLSPFGVLCSPCGFQFPPCVFQMFSVWLLLSCGSLFFSVWFSMFSVWCFECSPCGFLMFSVWFLLSCGFLMFSVWFSIFTVWFSMFSVWLSDVLRVVFVVVWFPKFLRVVVCFHRLVFNFLCVVF